MQAVRSALHVQEERCIAQQYVRMVQVVDCRETDNRPDIHVERAQRKTSEVGVLQVSGAGTSMDNKKEGSCQSADRRDIFPQQGMPGRIQGTSY